MGWLKKFWRKHFTMKYADAMTIFKVVVFTLGIAGLIAIIVSRFI